ncbi:hypothetical protein GQR58_019979 [Nymphon striatum]|nr:hypothetical protein GQR58_019979 [Nymphon striatum]
MEHKHSKSQRTFFRLGCGWERIYKGLWIKNLFSKCPTKYIHNEEKKINSDSYHTMPIPSSGEGTACLVDCPLLEIWKAGLRRSSRPLYWRSGPQDELNEHFKKLKKTHVHTKLFLRVSHHPTHDTPSKVRIKFNINHPDWKYKGSPLLTSIILSVQENVTKKRELLSDSILATRMCFESTHIRPEANVSDSNKHI